MDFSRLAVSVVDDLAPSFQLSLTDGLFQFLIFAAGRFKQMRLADWFLCLSRKKSGAQGNVANVGAGHVQLRQPVPMELLDRGLAWKHPAPNLGAHFMVRKRELHDEADAAEECLVYGFFQIGGENG